LRRLNIIRKYGIDIIEVCFSRNMKLDIIGGGLQGNMKLDIIEEVYFRRKHEIRLILKYNFKFIKAIIYLIAFFYQ
jgi:hypothetical protein